MERVSVAIVGGGLAGLCLGLDLQLRGVDVVIFEKQEYPFHKVCGEYISNEVKPYFEALGIDLSSFNIPEMHTLWLSSPKGKSVYSPLDLGGFGISRYTLDAHLAQLFTQRGGTIHTRTTVQKIHKQDAYSVVYTNQNITYAASVVVGAYGKLSNLDRNFERSFFKTKTPYIGVKMHYQIPFNRELVALHNFERGYCGVSCVEHDVVNVCYLADARILKREGTVEAMQERVLSQNPHLKHIFKEGKPMWDAPKVISQVSFLPKTQVEHHVLMTGDSAGLIPPLFGNGMAMAIRSAAMAAPIIANRVQHQLSVEQAEDAYRQAWKKQFKNRLALGRVIHPLFGNTTVSEIGIQLVSVFPGIIQTIIKHTHGASFARFS